MSPAVRRPPTTRTLVVTGSATAGSNFYYSFADTEASGISQDIHAYEVDGVQAIAEATNSSSLTVSGTASASITYGAAGAMADVVGIDQEAGFGLTLSSATATNLPHCRLGGGRRRRHGQQLCPRGRRARASRSSSGAYDGYGGSCRRWPKLSSIVVSSVATASGTYVGYF
jgi:hypothetical protein